MQVQVRRLMAEKRHGGRVVITVRREGDPLLPPVARTLEIFGEYDLRKPMKVEFDGEVGQDAGGLTVELFHGISEALTKSPLFAAKDIKLLPVPSPNELKLVQLQRVGRVVVKMLHEGCHAPALMSFHPFFFRYLWERVFGGRNKGAVRFTPHDYEEFVGHQVVKGERQLLLMKAKDLQWYSFKDHRQQPPQEITVTPMNLLGYLRSLRDDIMAQVEEGLEAVVEGFQAAELVEAGTLDVLRDQNCTWRELRQLLTGQSLDRNMLVRSFEFSRDIPPGLAKQVREAVRDDLSNSELELFLHYVTGNSGLPPTHDFKIIIKYYPNRSTDGLPQAHTCFNTLDLPRYTSKQKFLKQLRKAFELYGGAYDSA
jgi:hypothetical protein